MQKVQGIGVFSVFCNDYRYLEYPVIMGKYRVNTGYFG